ncbi:MAG TPA: Gfo/Idh/MocA family oxidoreductase [Steroidobacteraceae bacterium]|jgi:scyllo-inositol 2-dehydrogenase (NADP+)
MPVSHLPCVGLIGFGLAGRTFHAPLIQAAGLRIGAVVTSQCAAVAETVAGAAVLKSERELFERDDIDIVVVATPNHLHVSQARAALEAGKHVVIDKPLSVTAQEARELGQLARAHALMLAVFHNRRWDSDFLTVRKLIDSGQLGTINAFRARWDRFRPVIPDRWKERAHPGNGMLYDLGSHLIDQAVQLFGRPQWLQADVFMQREGAVVDDGFEILLGNGPLRISLAANSLAASGDWRYVVHGSQASFFKPGLDPQEDQLRAGMNPLTPGFGVEPEAQWGKVVDGASGHWQLLTAERGRWLSFYTEVRRSIEMHLPPPVSADEAAIVIEILEAALQSSRERRRIELP